MANSAVSGILYTYPDNFRATKAKISAAYSGANLREADNFVVGETDKSKDFRTKFPSGKLPAFESDDGSVLLSESNAIAFYVANDELRYGYSATVQDRLALSAAIVQWMTYADCEVEPAACAYAFPLLKIGHNPPPLAEQDKADFCRVLSVLDKHLLRRTFMVGDRISLADISLVAALLLPYQFACDAAFRKPYGNVNRWFQTVANQPQVVEAIGEVNLCVKAPAGASVPDVKKQNAKKEESNKQKKSAEKSKKKEEEDDDGFDILEAPPKKAADPFAPFPKGNFDMDDFKRFYSNNSEELSIPYFFEKFDKEHYSVWHCEYNYADELVKDFMSSNLIRGMFQRLDKLRKNAFGSVCLFGADKDATISGVWVWRGHQLAFDLCEDWQIDSPSYTWTKLDYDAPDTKGVIERYFKWEGTDKDGRPFKLGSIFK